MLNFHWSLNDVNFEFDFPYVFLSKFLTENLPKKELESLRIAKEIKKEKKNSRNDMYCKPSRSY